MKDFEDSLELSNSSTFIPVQWGSNSPSSQIPGQPVRSLEAIVPFLNSQTHDCRAIDPSLTLEWLERNCQTLTPMALRLAQVLSLFASAPIPWEIVDLVAKQLQWTEQAVDEARLQLYGQLFQLTSEGFYQVYAVVGGFFKSKLAVADHAEQFKQAFTDAIVQFVQQIPHYPTEQQPIVAAAMPHVAEVARELTPYLKNEALYQLFSTLGNFDANQGRYASAETWYEQCLLMVQTRFGLEHAITAASLNNLAGFYQSQGSYAKAEPLLARAVAIGQQLDNRLSLATSLNNLAGLYKVQGHYDKAEPLYLQAMELKRQLLGDAHPSVATSLNNLASVYYAQGRYSEAEPLYKKALQLKKCLLGRTHSSLAAGLNNLASVYLAQGRYSEAESLFTQAVALSTQIWGESHANTANFRRNLQKAQQALAENPVAGHSLLNQVAQRLTTGTRRLFKFGHSF